jgi:hypothetical protein
MEGYSMQHLFYPYGDEEELRRAETMREADREFRKSRRRALYRELLRWLGAGRGPASLLEMSGDEEFRIDIGRIAGLVDGAGCLRPSLPPMDRALLGQWRRAFSSLGSEEEGESFGLRLHGGAWYLEGGARALVRLELLRTRGERSLRARARPGVELDRCEALEGWSCDGDLGAA